LIHQTLDKFRHFFTVKELFVLMNHLFTFEDKSSLFGKCGSMTIRCLEHSQYYRKLVLLPCTIFIAENGLNEAETFKTL